MSDYQLIVIGAGPGGYVAALHAAKLGLKTAVVENREAGGTCLNRGCVPTKTLLHSSQLYHEATSGAGINAGIHLDGVTADLPAIFANKNRISQTLRQGIESMFKGAKVDYLRGTGRITAPGEVEVRDAEGAKAVYSCEKILVATGSVPARPPIPGLDLPGVMTSDEILDGAEKLYESIVIIGGGVIGVELATFYCELGCKVTIVEGLDRLLPNMDRELGQNLALSLKKQGVQIFTGSMVKDVAKTENGLQVNFTVKGEDKSAEGEVVLCAIGRRPYTEGLFAEGLAPEMNGRSLKVDEKYETSIPGIYAVGDVSSRIQLAHVASAQGTACVDMMCGVESSVNMNIVPSCVYCRPEIASVGMTEADAKAAGVAVKVGKCIMGGNARTLIVEAGRSFMKVVADAESRKILGAQMMCTNSTDMISQISVAIANGMTVEDMLLAMRPHPTFEEVLHEALEDLAAKLNR